jgi:arylsulfatase A-like enzyme
MPSLRPSLRPLAAATALAAAAGSLHAAAPASPPVDRPDVVFILIDDLRWDAVGYMGHPFLETPNIDRIRSRGASFSNAFVTTSICSPARATFLTGTYTSRHGVTDNSGSEYDQQRTPIYPSLLQQAGYRTAKVGKWHMGTHDNPREGFDYWLSFFGQGEFHNPKLNENGRQFEVEGYLTDILTDYAVRFIEESPTDQPFCLLFSHKAVHEPFQPAPRHLAAFADARLAEPPSYTDDFAGKHDWQRRWFAQPDGRRQWRLLDMEANPPPASVPAPRWQENQGSNYLNQLRLLLSVDEGIGRILETLEQRGTLDRTLIVFTSDNGYFHLEHRRHDKRAPYDEAIRIPFVIAYPGKVPANSTFDAFITNVDWAPTLLDFLGLEPPPSFQGRSFRPVIENRASDWEDTLFYEYWRELSHGIPSVIGIRTPDWKLLRYPEDPGPDDLYNLAIDPHELRNVANDPASAEILAKLRRQLDLKAAQVGWSLAAQPFNPAPHSGPARPVFDLAVLPSGPRDRGPSELKLTPALHAPALSDSSLRFDGRAGLTAPLGRLSAVDDYQFPIRISARVRYSTDGVIAAHAGSHEAWTLFIQDGRPGFGLRTRSWQPSISTLDGEPVAAGEWMDLVATVDYARMSFSVNGKEVGSIRLPIPFHRIPRGPLLLGQPLPEPLKESHPTSRFTGELANLRIEMVERASAGVAMAQ